MHVVCGHTCRQNTWTHLKTSFENEGCGKPAPRRSDRMGLLSRPPWWTERPESCTCALAHRCPQNYTQSKHTNTETAVEVGHMALPRRWYTHPGYTHQCSGSIRRKSICLEDKHICLDQGLWKEFIVWGSGMRSCSVGLARTEFQE